MRFLQRADLALAAIRFRAEELSVPPCASSSAPTLRPCVPLVCSMPNSSISMRSGVMVAALMTTNGPAARADEAWIVRAASSLPEPNGPTIRMRLLVGAALSIVWRSWFMTAERPTIAVDTGDSCLSSLTSRLSREVSSERSATRTRRSALNGFSMKS
jgi:hypothetical protein